MLTVAATVALLWAPASVVQPRLAGTTHSGWSTSADALQWKALPPHAHPTASSPHPRAGSGAGSAVGSPDPCGMAMLAMTSTDRGLTWVENRTLACHGPVFPTARGPGWLRNNFGCPDGSAVTEPSGETHLLWDFNTGEGSSEMHAGLGYSRGPSPTGPFVQSPAPINDVPNNIGLNDTYGFSKTYAGTILQRKSDWLIVTGIGGGGCGVATMTSAHPSGPYTVPRMVLFAQSDYYHTAATEPYPAFVHEGFVYVPKTSIDTNRNHQAMYRAPLEQATDPTAWKPYQIGSLSHWEGPVREPQGSQWGQTFSAFVDDKGEMQIMFPTLSAPSSAFPSGQGAINLARRPWDQPFRRGFWVSAPAAHSLAVMLKTVGSSKPGHQLRINATLQQHADSSCPWGLLWNYHGAIGPTVGPALTNHTALYFNTNGAYFGIHDCLSCLSLSLSPCCIYLCLCLCLCLCSVSVPVLCVTHMDIPCMEQVVVASSLCRSVLRQPLLEEYRRHLS